MNKIWFETRSGRLEIDEDGRFQMSNGKEYVRIKLDVDQLNKVVRFLNLCNDK